MPFLAPTFARLPPLDFLLADQMESRQKIARPRASACAPCSATRPAATHLVRSA